MYQDFSGYEPDLPTEEEKIGGELDIYRLERIILVVDRTV